VLLQSAADPAARDRMRPRHRHRGRRRRAFRAGPVVAGGIHAGRDRVAARATAVAAVAHFALGLSWPVGFMLGAIVSPPDAVAPMALMRHLRLPRRVVTLLDGEGPGDEATPLGIFSFSLEAQVAGTFSPTVATTKFVAIVVGEILFGIAVGWLMLRLRHHA